MYTVLLSGGSGKRLWPLSNALRSKQYIKLLRDQRAGGLCSMIQRVWGQLTEAGLAGNSAICASRAQVEIIRSQLKDVGIAVEPMRRDTFPAVALSCAYLKDKMGASDEDVVCVLPVDPFTEDAFFRAIKALPEALRASGAEVALLGVKPTEPSSKYGYIIPGADMGTYIQVDSFQEKPDEALAERLIENGALWNCGVFCLRIGDVLKRLKRYGAPSGYDGLYEHYEKLPRISFDYEVLEKAEKLAAVGFDGVWKDLGTWDALSGEMGQTAVGHCILDGGCPNTHVVNEMDIPVVAIGVNDLMIVASYDGILIADKERTHRIKDLVDALNQPPMYEERRWGTIKVLDISGADEGRPSVTRKLQIFKGQNTGYQYHENLDKVWTILEGDGELILDGKRRDLRSGDSLRISRGARHALRARTELTLLEVQVGEDAGGREAHQIASEWEDIQKLIG